MTDLSEATTYARFELGPGLLGWVYDYRNPSPKEHGGMATGLELGVQLEGDWWHAGSLVGERLYRPGEVHTISPAEEYSLAFAAKQGRRGRQVGFILYPQELPGGGVPDDVIFDPEAPPLDRELYEMCRAFAHDADRGEVWADEVRDEVMRFVSARLIERPADPLAEAKRALDEGFVAPLYLEHLAEIANMHPTTFSRKFSQRYGSTPIRYRLRLRINHAARLTWAAPELSVADIAEAAGFEDLPYFHRTFRKQMGATPAAYGRRSVEGGAGGAEVRALSAKAG